MDGRVFRAMIALALIGGWAYAPAGALLGGTDGVVWLLVSVGLVAGATLGWMGQHLLQRPMTRLALTHAGFAAAALLPLLVLRGAVTSTAALADIGLIVARAGTLAWGVRLLLPPEEDEWLAKARSRTLQVEVRRVRRGSVLKPVPRVSGRFRAALAIPMGPHGARLEPALARQQPREQKAS